MAGVFISYKKEDRDRVRPLVEGLRQDGIEVWWDQDIASGAPWEETSAFSCNQQFRVTSTGRKPIRSLREVL